MAPTSAARRAQAQDKGAEPRLSGLIGAVPHTQTPLKDVEGGEWFLACVGRAIDAAMARKTAALTMGVDQGLLTNQLKAEGHLSARRLGLMPESFWLVLIDELRAHFRVDDDAQRLERALDGLQSSLSVIGQIARKGLR